MSGRPERADLRRLNPGPGNPIISAISVVPVARRPEIAVVRARRLLVVRQRGRRLRGGHRNLHTRREHLGADHGRRDVYTRRWRRRHISAGLHNTRPQHRSGYKRDDAAGDAKRSGITIGRSRHMDHLYSMLWHSIRDSAAPIGSITSQSGLQPTIGSRYMRRERVSYSRYSPNSDSFVVLSAQHARGSAYIKNSRSYRHRSFQPTPGPGSTTPPAWVGSNSLMSRNRRKSRSVEHSVAPCSRTRAASAVMR